MRFDISSGAGGLSFTGTDSIVDTTGLIQPSGLTFGPAGDGGSLYVTSSGTDTVVKIADATGAAPTASTFITGGANTGNLNYPSGLTWGPAGKLYVVDLGRTSNQGNVLSFNADGSFNEVYAQPNGGGQGSLLFQFPSDLVFDAQGRLDVGNLGPAYPPDLAGSINRYDSSGVFDTTLVSSTQFPNTTPSTSGISPSELAFVTSAPTTTTVSTDQAGPYTTTSPLTFTATVAGDPSVGTVTFYAGPGLANQIGSPVPVINGVAESAPGYTFPSGNNTITAVYSGGIGFASSQGTDMIQVAAGAAEHHERGDQPRYFGVVQCRGPTNARSPAIDGGGHRLHVQRVGQHSWQWGRSERILLRHRRGLERDFAGDGRMGAGAWVGQHAMGSGLRSESGRQRLSNRRSLRSTMAPTQSPSTTQRPSLRCPTAKR